MKNAVSKQTQEYDTPSRSAGEFRNFLSHFWNLFETNGENENRSLEPKIEFSEGKDAVNVSAEVPGMDEKDLNVEISSDGYLTISGEKKTRLNIIRTTTTFRKSVTACFAVRFRCRGISTLPKPKPIMKTAS